MTDSPRLEPLGNAQKWTRRARQLDLGSLVVTALAATVYLITLLTQGGELGNYLGLFVTVVGVVLTRRFAVYGTAVVLLGSLTAVLLGTDPLISWDIAVFTGFSVALRNRGGILIGAFLGVGAFFAVVAAEDRGFNNSVAFVALAMTFMAAAFGSALRSYLQFQREAELRTLDALASRDAETHQRVAEERLRIARDLHDVVGHEIAVLGIHLGVAEVNLPTNPAAVGAALDAARERVQSVLAETQRILHILRTDGDADDSLPTPDYARIPDLVETYRSAGDDLRVELSMPPGLALDPAVSTAAYRMVQESLTNAHRHGTGQVRLTTTLAGRLLTIVVENSVGARPADRQAPRGFGLVGMRERVLSAGGQLTIDDAGAIFRVEARLSTDGKAIV